MKSNRIVTLMLIVLALSAAPSWATVVELGTRYDKTDWAGLSSDTKPTTAKRTPGSTYYATDTGVLYLWAGSAWVVDQRGIGIPWSYFHTTVSPTSDVNVTSDKGWVTYITNALGSYVPTSRTVNGHALSNNINITATDIGLGNCNNTSDVNKPISSATQTALNAKITTGAHGDVYTFSGAANAAWTKNNIYYWGNPGIPAGTLGGNRSIPILKAGTINVCTVNFYNSGTLASNETSSIYLRKNNTTDYLISSSVVHNAVFLTFSATNLGISVVAGDQIEVKEATGNFTIAPTQVYPSGCFIVE